MSDLQREWLNDLPTQRFQENVSRKVSNIQSSISDNGIIINEVEATGVLGKDQVKSYTTGIYEIKHNLGKQVSFVQASATDGYVMCKIVDSNPENKDRTIYVRVEITVIKVSGSSIVTDSSSVKIKFMVA